MGIMDDLADDRAKFISLHDALKAIASNQGCDYGHAAAWLYRKLKDRTQLIYPPDWYQYTLPDGRTSAKTSAVDRALVFLQQAAHNGDPSTGWLDVDYSAPDEDYDIPF